MTDPIIYIPSGVTGLILVLIYLYRCHRSKETVNPAILTGAILSGSGIVCGVLLIIGSFYKGVMDHLTGINLYILIAGLAVCYVSALTIYRDIWPRRNISNNGQSKPSSE